MADPVALAALAGEAVLGWPDVIHARIGHPVGLFARWLGHAESRWNRPGWSDGARRLAGLLTVLLLLGATGLLCGWIERMLHAWLGRWAWPAIAALALPGLAQRSLHDHVAPIEQALSAGRIDAARERVGRIVGRDTGRLDRAGVARAAIESLAESFCDGVAAPAFWLIVAGLPGIWCYKALNTADSLIGHREERWRAFGWAAARGDDLANWIPARISALLICLVAGRGETGRGWSTVRRDARRHASPNAGWPEAAMAGALGLSLAGPVWYDGIMHDKPWIGDGRRAADAADIARALILYRRACLLLWIVAGGAAWAL